MYDVAKQAALFFVQASIFLIAPALARSASCCYGIEELTIDYAQHIAPKAVQQFMQSAVQGDFRECVQESGISPDAREHYFGSVKIALSRQSKKHHLVFPSSYCGAFHGAHAIAYWLVEEVTPIRFRILYSGRSDGLTLYTEGHCIAWILRRGIVLWQRIYPFAIQRQNISSHLLRYVARSFLQVADKSVK